MASSSVRVEKATSDLLMGPDWTMNMEICDSVNSDHWQAKDVIKLLKKRLQHKNPKVQFLALTLLETMIKNCGDYVHHQVAERNILEELIKIVRKKTDMQVREKILILLDSWQEAFGGPNGKYPQYYLAYQELRGSGVQFPKRSSDAAPIFTPPAAHLPVGNEVAGYGMPNNASQRLDEAMAMEGESLSLLNLDSFGRVMELLADMLHAVDSNDREAVKDEVIVDLVGQCHSNQKRLMLMLNSTGEEELLGRGLELNDKLQTLLAEHEAMASGSPWRHESKNVDSCSSPKSPVPPVYRELPTKGSTTDAPDNGTIVPVTVTSDLLEEDEDDEFAQLARRPSKASSEPLRACVTSHEQVETTNVDSNKELALPDPPTPVRASAEENYIIDLLSLSLTTVTPSAPHTPLTTAATSVSAGEYSGNSQSCPAIQPETAYNSYVAPWARPSQPTQSQFQTLSQHQPGYHFQAHLYPHLNSQSGYSQNLTRYPPPPWAVPPTPGYSLPPPNAYQQSLSSTSAYAGNAPMAVQSNSSEARVNNTASTSFEPRSPASNSPMQQGNSFNTRLSGASTLEEFGVGSKPRAVGTEQKPFIPSYRLFEDLIDVRNLNGQKTSSGVATNLAGPSGHGQSMLGGERK